jgi:hypothetical protein
MRVLLSCVHAWYVHVLHDLLIRQERFSKYKRSSKLLKFDFKRTTTIDDDDDGRPCEALGGERDNEPRVSLFLSLNKVS